MPSDPMQTLMVYVYEYQRKIGPRYTSYEATIDLCRIMFTLPIQHSVTLHTRDLNICDRQLAEIYSGSWETVVNHLMEVVVNSQTPVVVIRDVDPRVIVKTQTGKELRVSITDIILVDDLKARIQDIDGIPPDQQRLIFSGRQLEGAKTLSDYGIQHESTIFVVLRLRGGKPIIYLLAPEPIEASVELSLIPQWSLSAIYPVVPIKPATLQSAEKVTWKVHVHPNGELTELSTGLDVAYLYWEALTNSSLPSTPPASPHLGPIVGVEAFDPTNAIINDRNAVVMAVERITPYLDKALKALGLHTEARTSFITYWLPTLLKHEHVAFRFLPQASYEQAAQLDISPPPDVITRVFMIFQGVEESELGLWSDAQAKADDEDRWVNIVGVDAALTMDESLFRVVEWGGMEVVKTLADV